MTITGEILAIAATQDGAIMAAQLRPIAHAREVQAVLASGHLRRLWRGAYAAGPAARGRVPLRTRLTAAQLTLRRPVIPCLNTAAEIHGFAGCLSRDTHVLTDGSVQSTRTGLVVHRHRPIADRVTVDGQPVEDPAECAVRLAVLRKSPAAALAVLDAAVHCGAVASVGAIVDRVEALSGRGVHRLRSLAPLADGASRSAADSWVRWACLERAFDVPIIAPRSRPDLSGGFSPATPDYVWHRYEVTATLTSAGDARLRGGHAHTDCSGAHGPTRLFLERVDRGTAGSGLCPLHPAARVELLSTLLRARARWLRTTGIHSNSTDRLPLRRPGRVTGPPG